MTSWVISLSIIILGINSHAESTCTDANFNALESYVHYDGLANHKDFTLLFESWSPAPLGFEYYFKTGTGICHEVYAKYLKHNASGKTYIMYTTHEHYCDGDNTMGIIIDLQIYQEQKIEASIVADVGDQQVICR